MDVVEDKTLRLIVKSPAGVLFKKVGFRSIQLELPDGKLGIHAGHAPMIAEISDGEIILDDGKSIDKVLLRAGIAVVQGDVITVYTHSIDPNFVTSDNRVADSAEDFDELYNSIISKLLPGSVNPESQYDT